MARHHNIRNTDRTGRARVNSDSAQTTVQHATYREYTILQTGYYLVTKSVEYPVRSEYQEILEN